MLQRCGAHTRQIQSPPDLNHTQALLLCSQAPPDTTSHPIIRAALHNNLPILAIGSSMHTLNLALGGKPPKPTPTHAAHHPADTTQQLPPHHPNNPSTYHHIYISPGSKLARIVGSGGFVRINSRHPHSISEAQKSPHLLASAYSLQEGYIEALESPQRPWVIGVQFHPERRSEIPPHFDRLFQSLTERAAERLHTTNSPY